MSQAPESGGALVEALREGRLQARAIPKGDIAEELVPQLLEEGISLMRSSLTEAQRLAMASLALSQKVKRDDWRASSYRLLGHVQLLKGKPSLALPKYEQAISLFEALGPSSQEDLGVTLSATVQARMYLGQVEEAFEAARQAEVIFTRLGSRFRLARLQVNVANALHRLDRAEEALPKYQEALRTLQELEAHQDAAIAMRNLAVCFMALHRLSDAERLYQEAGDYFRRQGMKLLEWEVLSNQAYLWGRQGLIQKALAQYRHLLDASEAILEEAGFEAGNALLDQAEFLAEVGLFTDAASAARRCQSLFRSLGLEFELGKSLFLEALCLRQLGRPAEARTQLRLARPKLSRTPSPLWKALGFLLDGWLALDEGKSKAACDHFRSSLDLLGQTTAKERQEEAALGLAEALLGEDKAEEAISLLEMLSPSPLAAARRESLLAKARSTLGSRAEALSHALLSLDLLEGAQTGLGSPLLRTSFLSRSHPIPQTAFNLAEGIEDRWQIVQQAKARVVRDLISARQAASLSPRGEALRRELAYIQHEEAARDLASERGPSPRRAKLEEDLAEESRLSLLTATQPLSSQALSLDQAKKISRDAVLVEFFQSGDSLWAFCLEDGEASLHRLAPPSQALPLLESLHFHLGRGLGPGPTRGEKDACRLLKEVGEALLPFLGPSGKPLVFMPSGLLHGAPLHAAVVQGEPLCWSRPISYCPSSSLWASLGRPGPCTSLGPLILATGDERAPEIEEEASDIASLYPGSSLHLGGEAGLRPLLELGPHRAVIHLASHGIFRRDQPLLSSIRLGDDEVCPLDLSTLTLPGSLVVLSGCSTALSEVTPGEDSTGLAPAFLTSGASCVLGSLWRAKDGPSRMMMTHLHRLLAGTGDPSTAWSEAVREVAQAHPHPSHWAPFALFGRPQKIDVSSGSFAAPILQEVS